MKVIDSPNPVSICQFSTTYSRVLLYNSFDEENELTTKNRSFRRFFRSKRFRNFFETHRVLKIAVLAGLTLAAIITFCPRIRKLIFSLYYLIKYKVYSVSSLKGSTSIEEPSSNELNDLGQSQPKSKRERAFVLLLPLLGIVVTLLTKGNIINVSGKVQPEIEAKNPEVPNSRGIRDSIILVIIEILIPFFFGGK